MKKWDIASVAERWKEVYCPRGVWLNDTFWRDSKNPIVTDREAIHQRIVAS
jgi:hypothetical protein